MHWLIWWNRDKIYPNRPSYSFLEMSPLKYDFLRKNCHTWSKRAHVKQRSILSSLDSVVTVSHESIITKLLRSKYGGQCTQIWGSVSRLQDASHTCMRKYVTTKKKTLLAHPTEQDIQFLIWACIYIHTLCVRASKALASMRICADPLELSLLTDAISIKISCSSYLVY